MARRKAKGDMIKLASKVASKASKSSDLKKTLNSPHGFLPFLVLVNSIQLVSVFLYSAFLYSILFNSSLPFSTLFY